jgi:hypothetical protein
MTERRRLLIRLAPALLVLLLAGAWLLPAVDGLDLASAEAEPVAGWQSALDALPPDAVVLVGFDPDIGTYPEIRPTVRAAVADLLNRGARLAFVNLTAEGRALLLGELRRLERATANPARLLDLGYLPGAEAALVSLASGPSVPAGAAGAVARDVATDGFGAIDAALVVGGNDLGPRSWVEQLLPRVDRLPLLAIAPTTLLPELQPYLDGGQLDALLATPRDGAAYRAAAELGPLERLREVDPAAAPVLLGLIVAILVIGQAWATRVAASIRDAGHEAREQA